MMPASIQLPFDFAFDSEARFSSFGCEEVNAPLLHQLQQNTHSSGQFTWLWGSKGCGKSHLLQAFCLANPEAIYLPIQKLLAYEPHSLHSLQHSSLLVLDDVELLAGQREWEEQLFIVCQQLLVSGGRLLCASLYPPAQVPLVIADLRSRLQLALIYEVHELSDAGKARVLVERAKHRGIELRDEVVSFILARNQRNLHDLMAVLDQLDRQALAEQRKITIPFIKACLGW